MARENLSKPEEVRTIVDQLGMSPNQLARKLICSVQSVHRWLKNGAATHRMVQLRELLQEKDLPTTLTNSSSINLQVDLLKLDKESLRKLRAICDALLKDNF